MDSAQHSVSIMNQPLSHTFRESLLLDFITGIVVIVECGCECNGFQPILISYPLLRIMKAELAYITLYPAILFYVEPSGGHCNECGVLMKRLWF
jgi:hypothetical protein